MAVARIQRELLMPPIGLMAVRVGRRGSERSLGDRVHRNGYWLCVGHPGGR
jgi:hypothetical protein